MCTMTTPRQTRINLSNGSDRAGAWALRKVALLAVPLLTACLGPDSCDPQHGTRLRSESSSTGLAISYQYSDGTNEISSLAFAANAKPDSDVLLGGQPSPSVYPTVTGSVSSEMSVNYVTGEIQAVEYLHGAVGTDPSSLVAVPMIEATYYDLKTIHTLGKAEYDYIVFGDPHLNDQSAQLRGIHYYDAAGRIVANLLFDYDRQGNVSRSSYFGLKPDDSQPLDFKRVRDYTWDGKDPAGRYRFLALYMPEGEFLTYSHLAQSNLASMHTTITDGAGRVTLDTTTIYDRTYDAEDHLTSVQANGVRWDLAYEQYDLR